MKFVVVALVAAGIGGVYAVGTFVFGQIAKSRSLQRLPEVARDLGLSPNPHGDIEGDFRGRRVSVLPTAASVAVALPEAPALFVTTLRRYAGPAPDLPSFDSGDRRFDRTFPVRRAAPDVAQRLTHDAALRERMVDLASSGRPRIASLTIGASSEVSIWVGEGGPWEHHLPADQLETLLVQAVELADALEQRLR